MGSSQSQSQSKPDAGAAAAPPSACPMRADGGAAPSGRAAAAEPPKASGCPVDHSKWSAWAGRSAAAAGGDGEADINPDNRMPVLSQQPAAGQDAVLDTSRVVSSIPQGRAGATERWVYPSEQQFYNALVRKGKDDGVDTAAMPSVLEYERLHCDTCDPAKVSLLRFQGRPFELSPKARLKTALGLAPRPFDRHDWTVDRPNPEVRYIIDYYDASASREAGGPLPSLHDPDGVPTILMDVRPAGDTPGELLDRARMVLQKGVVATLREALTPIATSDSTVSAPAAGGAAAEAAPPPPAVSEAAAVRSACASAMEALSACMQKGSDDAGCMQARMGLTMCIAQQVCSAEADLFHSYKGSADGEGGVA
ncbi:putative holocytochrome c synthase [Emiliania huxleyi CCMP1516]|uniref:Holocytochrome c-type synthase n=2 Tax=Emiliania huxleyi TaxID=2903 RepID=A0A0D3IIV0_EMIH1|nr:putative holocytochrome c synthase [Emiliania huxleyi CCMP1516]EOD11185.1 putative holocytochrome c synthase [Emiliania huxleyi CCMP1516]|eukprot:XP_005763614.1 putative holocytochrome c synthase [Emiliania huxleyi CCMP1516]